MRSPVFASLVALLPALVHCVSTSDALQDADVPQSGYLPNHNMDPAKISSYKRSWTQTFNAAEMFYAKPLVWTPPGGGTELVIVVSNQNVIRVLNGATGVVQNTRVVRPPFQAADSQCGDIPNTIGITGTPIIDAATNIMYFYSKGYKGGGTGGGTLNGEYKLYAVNLPALSDVAGFPISMEGRAASNDNTRYFVGGTVLQRPGLAMVGNSIVAGFGGHCDMFNYTGMLVAASKTSGVGITNMQAMVARPGAPSPQPLNINDQTGGKAGIWQSGMGIAADSPNSKVYFVTGNARGPGELKGANGVPTSGKTKISTLEQTVASFSVASGGLEQKDWFAPYNYDDLNGGDRDFGSSGVALLDPDVFSGGGVNRIAVATGKDGKVYVLDADNLGGFKNGAGNTNGVLQTIATGTSFFGGIGSYPGDGGYIYFCPTGDLMYAYKFGIANGKPQFTLAGHTSIAFAGQGIPTVTSLNGKAGSGIVWLADVNQGLVAYKAIPEGGLLQPLTLPATGRLTKFQRPVFGNTRVYTTVSNQILGLAPPGDPPPPPPPSSSTSTSTIRSTSSSLSSTTRTSTSSTTSSSTSRSTSTGSTTSSTTRTSTSSSSTSSITTSSRTSSNTSTSSTRTSTASAYVTPTPPSGKTITLNWSITWVRAAPDGFSRPMIGVNGVWPCPPIVANYGDQIKLNVFNGLGNESTAIHFHGLFQKGVNYEDGPAMVTQCPIPPGESFVYQFKLTQLGTYWYHAHVGGSYIDGLRGPLIVKDPNPPFGKVDSDTTLTLSDIYHDEAPSLIHYYLSSQNSDSTGGAEPVPNAALINEAQNGKFPITPGTGKSNLFRIINMGALAGQYLQFDQHIMTIVEVDGVYCQPTDVSQLFVAVAQRYSVIVRSKPDNSRNYAIVASMNTAMFGTVPQSTKPNVAAWLVYDAAKPLPAPFSLTPQPFDDGLLTPLDLESLLDPPTLTFSLTASFGSNAQGSTRAYFNGVSYVPQKVPTLYSALTAPSNVLNNPAIYGQNANPFVLPFNSIVELTINNHDSRAHPFHLHGHNFQLIYRGDGGANFPGLTSTPATPMRRDTLVVFGESGATIRFRADNPGIQLFHCHTEWHVESGLTATFIEAPSELVLSKPYIPTSHRDVCDKYGILRKGNAAGNSKDWLDLTGANTQPPANYWGALVNPPNQKRSRAELRRLPRQ